MLLALEPGGSARKADGLVVGALLLILGADFAFPLRRGLSLVLLALVSVLVFPWARRVVLAGHTGAARHSLEAWSFRIAVLALAPIVLAAKWWLLAVSGGSAPEHFIGSSRSYTVALGLVLGLGALGSGLRLSRFLTLVSDHPARLIVLSFGAVGVIGGLVLSLPVSLQRLHELSLVDNLFMAFTHVAHDCRVGNRIVMANYATLAGHVELGDWVIMGGYSGTHQFTKVGAHAFIGNNAAVTRDVPPYVMAVGTPAVPHSINSEGLKRRGFTPEQIRALKNAYRVLYRSDLKLDDAIAELRKMAESEPVIQPMIDFIGQSTRSLVR